MAEQDDFSRGVRTALLMLRNRLEDRELILSQSGEDKNGFPVFDQLDTLQEIDSVLQGLAEDAADFERVWNAPMPALGTAA